MIHLASRRFFLAGVAVSSLIGLSACGRKKETEPVEAAEPVKAGPPEGSLEWAVEGPWRSPEDKARDQWRHPMETLRFFGLQPAMKVVEFWPGGGWYTDILAPYLNKGRGQLTVAGFVEGEGADPAQVAVNNALKARLDSDKKLYGQVGFTYFGLGSGPVIEPLGTADLVLFMRYVHVWMAAGLAEKAFSDAFAALRPGGTLGIEQHRLGSDEDQDPAAANGYVQEAFLRQLAEEAGFVFVESSEINANPDDTKNHPFGVETLPPTRRSSALGEPPNFEFDHSKYDAIGESDRMTLKFRKPE
ncbi:class I SAM-dependent methyltransferase [Brevundimonas sp.]|uniref:class I SAM-dependent methyltransferase n=1 Tax=Brevundimonas sp. TaxID=1871086 RepID=UPI002FC67618